MLVTTTIQKRIYSILLFAIPAIASAQVPPQYQAGYNQVMKNHSFQMQSQQFARQMNNFYYAPSTNLKYEYNVLMKDSSELLVNSIIHFDELQNKHYLVYINKKIHKGDSGRTTKIYCDETLHIRRIDKLDYSSITGNATDSCWLFQSLPGKITLYSSISEPGNNGNFVAFRYDNGPVQPLILEKLEAIIKENEKAYTIFQKKKYFKAVQKYNGAYAH